jgi:hypothetical protein
MSSFNTDNARVNASEAALPLEFTGSARAWFGKVDFYTLKVTANGGAATLNVYDGFDNTGQLLWSAAAPAVGGFTGPKTPLRAIDGLFVEVVGAATTYQVYLNE